MIPANSPSPSGPSMVAYRNSSLSDTVSVSQWKTER